MAYSVHIDKEACISSGRCVARKPDAFAFDDDELGEPKPAAALLDGASLLAVARDCPGGAIRLTDANGREVEL